MPPCDPHRWLWLGEGSRRPDLGPQLRATAKPIRVETGIVGVLKLVMLVKKAECSKSHCHGRDRLSLTRDMSIAFLPGIDYLITSYLLVYRTEAYKHRPL